MKQRASGLLRKAQFPVLLAAGIFPLPMMLFLFFAADNFSCIWIFPSLYILWTVAACIVPGKLRLIFGLLGCALLALVALWMQQAAAQVAVIPSALLYGILLFMSLGIATWSKEDEPPFWISLICLGLHLLLQALIWMFPNYPPLQENRIWSLLSFVCFALLQMLSLNRICLHYAAAGKTMSAGMKQKNIALTLITAVAAAILASFRYLWELLWKLFTSVILWIKSIGSKGMGPSYETETRQPFSEEEIISGPEGSPILLLIFRVLLIVAAVVLLFFLLRKLLKKLLRFLASLRRYASLVTEDYTEEITSTVDEDSAEAIRKHRRRSLLRQQDVHKLPPAKQIRYYYLRLLHRHNEWPNASTARENLPQECRIGLCSLGTNHSR